MDYIFVYATFPDEESAASLAQSAIEKQLAACANIFPRARSFYRWEGKVQDASEAIMILKTRRALWPNLRDLIETGHPYEVPCVTAISMLDANETFLNWLNEQVI